MSVERDFAVFLESLGGEDLIRWLIKDEGIVNWNNISLYPIVAYTPDYLIKPIVVGVAYNIKGHWIIMAQEWNYEHLPYFQEYVDYLMEMGGYDSPVDALFDHNRALILNDVDIIDAKERGIEAIMIEVLDGNRSNGYTAYDEFDDSEDECNLMIDDAEKLFSYISDLLNSALRTPINAEEVEFDENWQKSWA